MKLLTILFFAGMLLISALTTPVAVAATATPDGTFGAIPTSIHGTQVGANCLLTVQGQLIFFGRLTGLATGTTYALVFADCDTALVHLPGTFADVFRSELTYTGTIDGIPITNAVMIYQGQTAAGGVITGQMRLANDGQVILSVEGKVAEGGRYWFRTP